MSTATPILIPLLNPNEPEARLAAVYISEGQQVTSGDPLFMLETTKATQEVTAEDSGYIVGLELYAGQAVRAGDLLGYIAGSPDWQPPAQSSANQKESQERSTSLPQGLRITQPALDLAERHHLELSRLPVGTLVTEKLVQELLESRPDLVPPPSAFDPTAILVYGGGGHGKALIDLLRALGTYHVAAVIDDVLALGTLIMGVPVRGGEDALPVMFNEGVRLAVNAVGGIGNVAVRIKVFQVLARAGFVCPALVHPSAWVEPSAVLFPGVQVMPHAYVGSEARVGFGAIINTNAIVSHDCQIGDYANLSPGAILAGEVQVGAGSLVGMGATVNLRVSIGRGARIGNSATVKADVPENGIVRAGTIWPQ